MKKKLFIVVSVIIATMIIAAVFVACTPEKLEKIVGTYELTIDTYTQYEQETVDRMKEYGKESYLVVTGEKYGYYVYKDKDTPAYAVVVGMEYSKNDEGKVTSVSYWTEVGDKKRTLNVDSKNEISLISRWPSASKLIDAYETQYKKVSDKTDLSHVKTVYGDIRVFDFNVLQYDSLFCEELGNGLQKNYSLYVYDYYDVDAAAKTATRYYALKSDKKPVTVENLKVSFARNEENDKPIKMIIGENEYSLENGTPQRQVVVDVDGVQADETLSLSWMNYLLLKKSDYETYFNGLISEYEKSLVPETEEPEQGEEQTEQE